jgi:hypothetical protein
MEKLIGKSVLFLRYVVGEKERDPVPAIFMGVGCEYEEFESGAGNFTTAIIMLEDGKMQNVPIGDISFGAHVYDELLNAQE